MKNISFKIYNSVSGLPHNWDEVSHHNHFLQTPYLNVLEKSAPTNMECFFIGIFEDQELIGTSLAQYLDLNKLESFGERDNCFKTKIRNFVFKNFASHVLFLGNNMITGQNGYTFNKEIDFESVNNVMMQCTEAIIEYFKKKKIRIHIVSYKDFYNECSSELKKFDFGKMHEFTAQPNMIFYLDKNWKTREDYFQSFLKNIETNIKERIKNLMVLNFANLTLKK